MTIEQTLKEARELPRKAEKIGILLNFLTLLDLGGTGYAATFAFEGNLPPVDALTEWFERADDYPRSAFGTTAVEAIQKAIAKCETEFSDHVKKNFRYSPEIQKEFCK